MINIREQIKQRKMRKEIRAIAPKKSFVKIKKNVVYKKINTRIKKGVENIYKKIDNKEKLEETGAVRDTKKLARKLFKSVATQYKKSQKPVKIQSIKKVKGPVPPQLQKYLYQKKQAQVQNQVQQTPMPSVRQLQSAPSIRHLLTQQEQNEIDRLIPSVRRAAAIQIINRRIKDQRVEQERINPQVIRSIDPFNHNRIIEKRVLPRERWTQ